MELNIFQKVLNQVGIREDQISFQEYDPFSGEATLNINGQTQKVDHYYELAEVLNRAVSSLTGDADPLFRRGQIHQPFLLIDRNQDGRSDGVARFDQSALEWNLKFYGGNRKEDKKEINLAFQEFSKNFKKLAQDLKRNRIEITGFDADPKLKVWLGEAITNYQAYLDSIPQAQNTYEAKVKAYSFQAPIYQQFNRIVEVLYDEVIEKGQKSVDISKALKLYEANEANFEAVFPFIEVRKPSEVNYVDQKFHPGVELYLRENGERISYQESTFTLLARFYEGAGYQAFVDVDGENQTLALRVISKGGELLSARCVQEGESPLSKGDDYIDPDSVGSEQCSIEQPGFDPLRLNHSVGFPELPRWNFTRGKDGKIDGVTYSFNDEQKPSQLTVSLHIDTGYRGEKAELVNQRILDIVVTNLYPHIRHARATGQAVPEVYLSRSGEYAVKLISDGGQNQQFEDLTASQFPPHRGGLTYSDPTHHQSLIWINTDIRYQHEEKRVQTSKAIPGVVIMGRKTADIPAMYMDVLEPVVVNEGELKGVNVGVIDLLETLPRVVLHESDHVDELADRSNPDTNHYFLDEKDSERQVLNLAYQVFNGDMKEFTDYIKLIQKFHKALYELQLAKSTDFVSQFRIEALTEEYNNLFNQRQTYQARIEAYFPSQYAFDQIFNIDENGAFKGFNIDEFNAEIAASIRGELPHRLATLATLSDVVRQDICLSSMDKTGLDKMCSARKDSDTEEKLAWSEDPEWFFIRLRAMMIDQNTKDWVIKDFVVDLSKNINWHSKELPVEKLVGLIGKLADRLLKKDDYSAVIKFAVAQIIKDGIEQGFYQKVKPLIRLLPKGLADYPELKLTIDVERGKIVDIEKLIDGRDYRGIYRIQQLEISQINTRASFPSSKISEKDKAEQIRLATLKMLTPALWVKTILTSLANGKINATECFALIDRLKARIQGQKEDDGLVRNEDVYFYLRIINRVILDFCLDLVHQEQQSDLAKMIYQKYLRPEQFNSYRISTNEEIVKLYILFDYEELRKVLTDQKYLVAADALNLRSALLKNLRPDLAELLDQTMKQKFLAATDFREDFIPYMKLIMSEDEIEQWVNGIMLDPRMERYHPDLAIALQKNDFSFLARRVSGLVATPGNILGDLLSRAIHGEEISIEELTNLVQRGSLSGDKLAWVMKVYQDQGDDWKVKSIIKSGIISEASYEMYRENLPRLVR